MKRPRNFRNDLDQIAYSSWVRIQLEERADNERDHRLHHLKAKAAKALGLPATATIEEIVAAVEDLR